MSVPNYQHRTPQTDMGCVEKRSALNTEQVAELLGISSRTVRRMARAGELPAFRVGGRGQLRFSPTDVRRLIDRRRVRTVEGAVRPHPTTEGLIHL